MAELLFKNPQDYLQFEYDLRRARRPSYSMRAFARDLKMSASGFNDFIKGRVGMSLARVEYISQNLNWKPERTEHFLDLLRAKFDRDASARTTAQARVKRRLKDGAGALTVDEFKMISEWHHLVILELCEMRDHVTAKQIAKELDISDKVASTSLRRLAKLKLIELGERGYKPSEVITYFGDKVPSEAIRFFHTQLLERAQKALQENAMHERSSQSMVFSVDSKEIKNMANEIRSSIDMIVSRYSQNSKSDSIQALTLQLFPVWAEQKDLGL